jgi:hypothetical protein
MGPVNSRPCLQVTTLPASQFPLEWRQIKQTINLNNQNENNNNLSKIPICINLHLIALDKLHQAASNWASSPYSALFEKLVDIRTQPQNDVMYNNANMKFQLNSAIQPNQGIWKTTFDFLTRDREPCDEVKDLLIDPFLIKPHSSVMFAEVMFAGNNNTPLSSLPSTATRSTEPNVSNNNNTPITSQDDLISRLGLIPIEVWDGESPPRTAYGLPVGHLGAGVGHVGNTTLAVYKNHSSFWKDLPVVRFFELGFRLFVYQLGQYLSADQPQAPDFAKLCSQLYVEIDHLIANFETTRLILLMLHQWKDILPKGFEYSLRAHSDGKIWWKFSPRVVAAICGHYHNEWIKYLNVRSVTPTPQLRAFESQFPVSQYLFKNDSQMKKSGLLSKHVVDPGLYFLQNPSGYFDGYNALLLLGSYNNINQQTFPLKTSFTQQEIETNYHIKTVPEHFLKAQREMSITIFANQIVREMRANAEERKKDRFGDLFRSVFLKENPAANNNSQQQLTEQQAIRENEQEGEVCLENMSGRAKLMHWAAKYSDRLVICLKCEDPNISVEITPVSSREEMAVDASLGRTIWNVSVQKDVIEASSTTTSATGKLARAFDESQPLTKKKTSCWSRKIVYLASGEKPPTQN